MVEAGARHGALWPLLRVQGAVGQHGLFPYLTPEGCCEALVTGTWKVVRVPTRSWSFLAAGF